MQSYLIAAIIFAVLGLAVVGLITVYNRVQRLKIKVDEALAGIDVALEKRFDLLSEQIEAVKKFLSHEHKLFTDVTALRTGEKQEENARLGQKELADEAVDTINKEIDRYSKDMEKIKGQIEKASSRSERHRRGAKERDEQKKAEASEQFYKNEALRAGTINQKVNVLTGAHRDLAGVGAGIDALTEQYPIMCSWVSVDKFQDAITNSEEHLQAARRLYNSNVSVYNQALVTIPWSIAAAILGMKKADFYEIEDKKRSFSVSFE